MAQIDTDAEHRHAEAASRFWRRLNVHVYYRGCQQILAQMAHMAQMAQMAQIDTDTDTKDVIVSPLA